MIDNEEAAKFPNYVNTLSSLPMFDEPKNLSKALYRTTYAQDFTKKVKYLDRVDHQRSTDSFSYLNSRSFGKLNMEPATGGQQRYSVANLSNRLREKNFKYDYNNLNSLADSSEFFTKSEYFAEPSPRGHAVGAFDNEPLSESHSSYRESYQYYKKPQIPSYIKKDDYFQSNSEKSLRFVPNHSGKLMPVADDETGDRPLRYKNSTRKSYGRQSYEDRAALRGLELQTYLGKLDAGDERRTALRSFYRDLKSESKESYTPKPLSYRSQITHALQNDVYHTNSNKNIRYIRMTDGSLHSYVPNQDELREEAEIRERAAALSDHKPLTNHPRRTSKHVRIDVNKLDLSEFLGLNQELTPRKPKLRNPESQLKRNTSYLDKNLG